MVGYDITDMIAVQIFGGGVLADTRRRDVVRDLALAYIGLGARFSLGLTDRLSYTAQAGAMFISADNAVEAAEQGFGLQFSTGVEYFVHLRHFSVGLEVTATLPVQPVRLFLALAPSFKYTF
jgi:hypothetical protein